MAFATTASRVGRAVLCACLCLGAPGVLAQSVTSFTLVNADTDTDIGPLADGAVLDLAALPTLNLNVRANVTGTPGSVRFGYDGNANYRTENVAPYALEGDTNGNYRAWTPALGTHTLTATPFAQARGRGAAGTPLTIGFTVVEDDGGGGGGGDDGTGEVTITGLTNAGGSTHSLVRYRPLTLTLDGPFASEGGAPNPFLGYRFDVEFRHTASGEIVTVPGYFAADGDAANTSAAAGTAWRAHLTPSRTGAWTYTTRFREGNNVAIADNPTAGTATDYDGLSGSFQVNEAPSNSPGYYAEGTLRYVGERYLRFDSGTPFIKGGADSPENLLAFEDFDGTRDRKSWSAHVADWQPGDPTWEGGTPGAQKGKGLVGALNYLASEGMNAVSFLTMNAPQGDGKDVWMWTSNGQNGSARLRYDVSKLDQWELVFSHADRLGLFLHFKTQETENDQVLDGGQLGTQRKLYYRELIARFAHHLALNWNLGEEHDIWQELGDPQNLLVKSYAAYIDALDAYDHPIVIHTYPGQDDEVYGTLVGHPGAGGSLLTGASIQLSSMSGGHAKTLKWLQSAADAGRPWHVALDEPGNAGIGASCDGSGNNHEDARQEALWANLMAGGTGVEWYFGYQSCASDLTLEDWRTRDQLWDYTRFALEFFRTHLPYDQMESADALTSASDDYVFALAGEVYAVYLPEGGTVSLALPGGTYDVRWFDPRNGGSLQTGSVSTVNGGGPRNLGAPPSASNADWAVLVTGQNGGGGGGGVTSWLEAFDDLPAGTTNDPGETAWSVTNAPSQGTFATRNDRFEVSNTRALGTWRSEVWSIAGAPVDVSLVVQSTGNMEKSGNAADELRITYRLDGGAEQDLFVRKGKFNNGQARVVSASNLAGNTLELIIRGKTTAPGEVYSWDDVSVTSGASSRATATALATVEEAVLPVAPALYPNPVTSSATLEYTLAESTPVSLHVYDLLGRRVTVQTPGVQAAGRHRATIQAEHLAPGLYHWVLRTDTGMQSGRMVVVR
ncbi:MAG: DUF5060 domain-containing protein [Bacteroidota bacterium]